MKNLGRCTLTLLVTLVPTSFASPIVENDATGFTVNGLTVILEPSFKQMVTTRTFIKDGNVNDDAGDSIDSAYYGNYRITKRHQIGIDRFITDDGKNAMLIS